MKTEADTASETCEFLIWGDKHVCNFTHNCKLRMSNNKALRRKLQNEKLHDLYPLDTKMTNQGGYKWKIEEVDAKMINTKQNFSRKPRRVKTI
jgi:hypothetical protein